MLVSLDSYLEVIISLKYMVLNQQMIKLHLGDSNVMEWNGNTSLFITWITLKKIRLKMKPRNQLLLKMMKNILKLQDKL